MKTLKFGDFNNFNSNYQKYYDEEHHHYEDLQFVILGFPLLFAYHLWEGLHLPTQQIGHRINARYRCLIAAQAVGIIIAGQHFFIV